MRTEATACAARPPKNPLVRPAGRFVNESQSEAHMLLSSTAGVRSGAARASRSQAARAAARASAAGRFKQMAWSVYLARSAGAFSGPTPLATPAPSAAPCHSGRTRGPARRRSAAARGRRGRCQRAVCCRDTVPSDLQYLTEEKVGELGAYAWASAQSHAPHVLPIREPHTPALIA
eukprot:COSAG06_NODE_21982_length_738_cov_2.037559_1_plen_176_part_00